MKYFTDRFTRRLERTMFLIAFFVSIVLSIVASYYSLNDSANVYAFFALVAAIVKNNREYIWRLEATVEELVEMVA